MVADATAACVKRHCSDLIHRPHWWTLRISHPYQGAERHSSIVTRIDFVSPVSAVSPVVEFDTSALATVKAECGGLLPARNRSTVCERSSGRVSALRVGDTACGVAAVPASGFSRAGVDGRHDGPRPAPAWCSSVGGVRLDWLLLDHAIGVLLAHLIGQLLQPPEVSSLNSELRGESTLRCSSPSPSSCSSPSHRDSARSDGVGPSFTRPWRSSSRHRSRGCRHAHIGHSMALIRGPDVTMSRRSRRAIRVWRSDWSFARPAPRPATCWS